MVQHRLLPALSRQARGLLLVLPCAELTLLVETLPASLPLMHPLLRTLKRPARMKLQSQPSTMQ